MLTRFIHQELPKGKWFCGTDCNRIHSALENLVVRGEQKLPDSLLNVVRKKHEEKGSDSEAKVDIRWRVLNWKLASSIETRQLLSKAVAIFHVSGVIFYCYTCDFPLHVNFFFDFPL
jgi:GTP cyclohydrolase FolE2